MSIDDSGIPSPLCLSPSRHFFQCEVSALDSFLAFLFFLFSLLHRFLFLLLLLLLAVVDIWQEISFSLKPRHRFFSLSLSLSFSHTHTIEQFDDLHLHVIHLLLHFDRAWLRFNIHHHQYGHSHTTFFPFSCFIHSFLSFIRACLCFR